MQQRQSSSTYPYNTYTYNNNNPINNNHPNNNNTLNHSPPTYTVYVQPQQQQGHGSAMTVGRTSPQPLLHHHHNQQQQQQPPTTTTVVYVLEPPTPITTTVVTTPPDVVQAPTPAPAPKWVTPSTLTPAEASFRNTAVVCAKCSRPGHKSVHCPNDVSTCSAVCAVHGKRRTMRNLTEVSPGRFECVPVNPCLFVGGRAEHHQHQQQQHVHQSVSHNLQQHHGGLVTLISLPPGTYQPQPQQSYQHTSSCSFPSTPIPVAPNQTASNMSATAMSGTAGTGIVFDMSTTAFVSGLSLSSSAGSLGSDHQQQQQQQQPRQQQPQPPYHNQ